MDIKILDASGAPVETSTVEVKAPVGVEQNVQPDDSMQRAVGQVLGIENESEFNRYQPSLKTLTDFAKTQTKDQSPESIKWVIRNLEAKLGTPPFAEDRVKFITRFVWLLMDEKRISEEKKKFERL